MLFSLIKAAAFGLMSGGMFYMAGRISTKTADVRAAELNLDNFSDAQAAFLKEPVCVHVQIWPSKLREKGKLASTITIVREKPAVIPAGFANVVNDVINQALPTSGNGKLPAKV